MTDSTFEPNVTYEQVLERVISMSMFMIFFSEKPDPSLADSSSTTTDEMFKVVNLAIRQEICMEEFCEKVAEFHARLKVTSRFQYLDSLCFTEFPFSTWMKLFQYLLNKS